MLWAGQSYGWYKQLRMLRAQALNAINNSWLRMIPMILGHEPMDLIVINSLELRTTWTNPGRELEAPDAMNSSGLCMTWTTLVHGLRALDAINNSGLLMTLMTQGCLLKALNVTNSSRLWWTSMNFGSWAQGFRCYEQLKIVDYINDFELWA